MPKGIIFISHHEIKGPEIKDSYFETEVALSQDFISQLYLTHSGFNDTSYMEMKFEHNKILSYFTGNQNRKTDSEGILGIIFGIDEELEDLDLFLRRNLVSFQNPKEETTLEDIYKLELPNYLNLLKLIKKYRVQDIEEILLLEGTQKFKKCCLNFSNKKKKVSYFDELYTNIIDGNNIQNSLYHIVEKRSNHNLVLFLKYKKNFIIFQEIFKSLVPFFETYPHFALELLVLFFLPNQITSQNRALFIDGYESKKIPLIKSLKKQKYYRNHFELLLSRIIESRTFLLPI